MINNRTANYLRDLGDLVKRSALEARARHKGMSDGVDRVSESGRLTAYCEVVSLVQQPAVAFGIGLDEALRQT